MQSVQQPPLAEGLGSDLQRWRPASSHYETLRHEYIAFARKGPPAFERSGGPAHFTASCFVFNAALTEVLLCFHKKGNFWVQLGGHIDPSDPTVSAAAFREAREESGIEHLRPFQLAPVDIDRHDLGPGFRGCRTHWDVGYAAIGPTTSRVVVSDESDDVRWWPAETLPDAIPPGFAARVSRVLTEMRSTP
jgi:8-oxo-dGTP pyrophosphatase MutT (NUDIX family)